MLDDSRPDEENDVAFYKCAEKQQKNNDVRYANHDTQKIVYGALKLILTTVIGAALALLFKGLGWL